jgi:hypothetical protein
MQEGLQCDICGCVAVVVRPPTRNRDLGLYCEVDAKRFLGWGDGFHTITAADVLNVLSGTWRRF